MHVTYQNNEVHFLLTINTESMCEIIHYKTKGTNVVQYKMKLATNNT